MQTVTLVFNKFYMIKKFYEVPVCVQAELGLIGTVLAASEQGSIPGLVEGDVPADLWD